MIDARVAGVPRPRSLSASLSCSSSTSLPAVSIAERSEFSVKRGGGLVFPSFTNGSCGPLSPASNAGRSWLSSSFPWFFFDSATTAVQPGSTTRTPFAVNGASPAFPSTVVISFTHGG